MSAVELAKIIASDVKQFVENSLSLQAKEYELIIKTLRKELDQKINGIELTKGEKGEAGEAGKDGVDGKDGERGVNGVDGKDGQAGKDGIDGKDGKDGESGKDGISPTPEQVALAMEGHFAKWALEFERKADRVLEKAIDRIAIPKDGKDGRDALEIKDFDISLDDDMRTITLSLKRDEEIVQKAIKIPAIIDKGVFKDGSVYEKGDAVTYGGSLWISTKDQPEGKPGTSEDFRLAVKRGRDGRESVKIVSDSKTVKLDGKK